MKASKAVLLVLLIVSLCVVHTQPGRAVEDSWVSKSPMPTARAFFGVAVVDGKIYAIGGSGGVNEAYDPETNTWMTKKPMPNPRTSFAITAYENKIYCIGGYANGTGTAINEVYDPRTDTWETKETMPTIRSQLKASAGNGKIYVIGGIRDGGEILNLNEVYDPATDTWTTKSPIPYGVYSHSSVVVGNRIYVISGQSASPGNSGPDKGPLNQIYNTEKDTWTLGATPPQPAHRSGAVVTSGRFAPKRIYVIGGEVGFMEATNLNQVYDPQTDTWSTGVSMPTARQGLGVAIVNDLIYALGGSFPANGFSTTTSSDLNKQYTTLGNAKVTLVNFLPQEHCGVNEQYTPIGYGTPDPSYVPPTEPPPDGSTYPLVAMPEEYINYVICHVNGSLWAKIDGTYPLHKVFGAGDVFKLDDIEYAVLSNELPLVYPTPPGTTNISVIMNETELNWSNYTQTHPEALHQTAIGDWSMIYCKINHVPDYFILKIHYEHPVPMINGSCTFLYDLNISPYLSPWCPKSTAYFNIRMETNYTNFLTYTVGSNGTWNPVNHTITKEDIAEIVSIKITSEYHKPLLGDLVVTFTEAIEPVQQSGFLGTGLPVEYGYVIVSAIVIAIVAIAGYLSLKRKKLGEG